MLFIRETLANDYSAVPEMDELIPFENKDTLHPEQWVKVYGICSNQYYFIITCQVFQLDAVLSGNQKIWWIGWWEGFLLESVDGLD